MKLSMPLRKSIPGLHYLRVLLWLAVMAGAGSLHAQMPTQQFDDYKLGAGDVISIHVYGEEDLTFYNVLITGRGKISYPFLGEIQVKGLTVGRLQQLLRDGLQPDYLLDPRIVVSIKEYRQFFVNGEVGAPGGYPFQPGLTLRKAISLAGGFTERASKSKIYVISDDADNTKPQQRDLAYKIKPGDIITVEQSFF